MWAEQHPAVDAFVSAFNAQDDEALRSLLASEFVDHTPVPEQGPGRDDFLRVKLAQLREAFGNLELAAHEVVVDGDGVAWRWTLRGENVGRFAGYPATGRAVAFQGLNLERLTEGRIVEHWSFYDSLDLLQQLGLFSWGPS